MILLIEERCGSLVQLCQRYGVRRLEVFGAAATEDVFCPTAGRTVAIADDPRGK